MKELRLTKSKMQFAKDLGFPERTDIETLQNFHISLTPYPKGEYSLILAGEINKYYFYAEYIQVGGIDDDYLLLDDMSEGFWDNPLEMIKEGLGL